MADPSDIPAVKLTAAPKKSLFEKQRQEAEAKRARDKAETAAIYDDFVKSFDQDGDEDQEHQSRAPPTGPGRRHFTGSRGGRDGRGGLRSGPGSLGPPRSGPGSLGPSKPRYGDRPDDRRRAQESGRLGYEEQPHRQDPRQRLANTDEDEDPAARPVPKPTIHLANLPPGLSISQIKALLPSSLRIENVRLLPPSTGSERKNQGAIITLAADTPISEIDAAVGAGQNSYLGRGYYLSLSRHTSTTSAGVGLGLMSSPSAPFGATPAPTAPLSLGRAPPPRGYAPPSSYHTASGGPPPVLMQISVRRPRDLKTLKLIHKTVEAILAHGTEFEALLMSRTSIQNDEKWAWLFDARSEGGVYYRWRIWEVLTRSHERRKQKGMPAFVFETDTAWVPPREPLPFEFVTEIEDVIEDSDYSSEDSDDSEDEARRRRRQAAGPARVGNESSGLGEDEGPEFLTPLRKARLVHMLASLPASTSLLRRGDVARIMGFAIKHAGQGGAEEIVELLVKNVLNPFTFSSANPGYEPPPPRPAKILTSDGAAVEEAEPEDTTPATQIALYILSDILSSSSTSGVRNAWRYRSLFQAALLASHVFRRLGAMEQRYPSWGRMRADKWRRSVLNLLGLWEGWCVFDSEAIERFKGEFEAGRGREEERRSGAEEGVVKTIVRREVGDEEMAEEDVDGEPMEDEELDGVPMDEVDGEPMEEDSPTDAPDPTDPETLMAPPTDIERPPPPPAPVEEEVEDMFGNPVPKPLPAPSASAAFDRAADAVESAAEPAQASPPVKRKRARASDLF